MHPYDRTTNTASACTCKITLSKKIANPTMHRMIARTNLTRLYKSSILHFSIGSNCTGI